MMATDTHAQNDVAQQFAAEHLAECARELLEWPKVQLPVDGRVRELSRMIAQTKGNSDALMLAVDMVNRLTLEATVSTVPVHPFLHAVNEEIEPMSDSAKSEASASIEGAGTVDANALTQIRIACEAQIKAWSEVRDQHQGMLIGKRIIVLDERGRAYSSLPDGHYKLEYPRSSLVGVSHFNGTDARDLSRRLESAVPQFAPYTVCDFEAYAGKRIEEAQSALHLVDARSDLMTSQTPLPESSSMWTITAASGEFVVNAVTGAVVSYSVYERPDDPDFRERAENIDRFNVAEYRQWFESVGLDEPTNLNWLGIGFWQKDGYYESFEQDWRDDLVVAMKDNRATEAETPEL